MSKIRANTQVITASIDRSLIDTSFEADLVKFADDITALGTNKADITYVDEEIRKLIDGSPDALNTLNELAAALADDANFATTVTNRFTAHEDRISVIENDMGYIKEADLVRGEVAAGAVDGTNTVFNVARRPRVGSVMVFKNGVADFNPDITVNESAQTITFAEAPQAGDKIHVCYEAIRVAS
ncbi:hypothetical protein [Pseudoalteromonas umbrosa]|uniref:hypothetical protein n=1 Tax=Pseudoalteromonas umbrosa TaxID=3048489 RepID=UPI0024C29987|nr:hypothetical protein [Pseudoalteromonas sp. B95]MDK1290093.1 hypothetical protein [Pseudoalteromonas sp. B95]